MAAKSVGQWIVGCALGAIALSACHADGTTFVVDTTADTVDINLGDGLCADGGGQCSLRAAIQEANATVGIDVVELGAGLTYTLSLAGAGEDAAATGDLDITAAVDINGDRSTIDAAGLDRVFDIRNGLAFLDGLIVTGGSAADGAAARVSVGAEVRMDNTVVTANTATAGAALSSDGGRFWAFGLTAHDNVGTTAGAMDIRGDGATLFNTTFSANVASAGPGALRVSGGSVVAWMTTVTDNVGTSAGGIEVAGGTLSMRASAVGEQAAGIDCAGAVTSDGYNVESGSSCGFTDVTDLQNELLGLDALADVGGRVPVHLPTVISVLVDTQPGGTCAWPLDARVFPRNDGACDTGAAERLDAVELAVNHGGDDVDANPGDGVCQDASGAVGECSLRAAIDETNAFVAPPNESEVIRIEPSVGVITLSRAGTGEDANATGDLDITGPVAIVGTGTVIDADGIDRVLHVHASAMSRAEFYFVGITGGVGDGTSAGGININPGARADINFSNVDANTHSGIGVGGELWLRDSNVTSNTFFGEGGGIRDLPGGSAEVHVVRSAIIDNHSGDDGGGMAFNFAAQLWLVNSTVSGNTAVVNAGGVNLDNFTSAEINNTTIVHNSAGDTGGLTAEVQAAGLVFIRNSVIALNTDSGTRANCNPGAAGYLTSDGWNFFGPGCAVAGIGSDIFGTDPMLGPLALNGAFSNNHVPLPGSPLVDAGNPAVAGTGGFACETVDQRRAIRGVCSIGSVEEN